MENHTSLLRLPQQLLDRVINQFRSISPKATLITASAATLTLFSAWVISDYRAWKAFGTGGTPATPSGYLRMTSIRISRLLSFDNLRDHTKLSAEGPSHLKITLPDRTSSRPKIQSRTMPQRQHPERLDYDSKSRLFSLPEKFTYSHPNLLTLDLSATEGFSTDAIYARPDLPNRPAAAIDGVLKDEIAHVHPAENSLHVWLSEADARIVVERGWGERFPLSAMGLCHQGFTFVYAPRDMDEVDVVEEIVRAGCAYVTGERIR